MDNETLEELRSQIEFLYKKLESVEKKINSLTKIDISKHVHGESLQMLYR